jgi:branched-chain amino acid transport system permease protein
LLIWSIHLLNGLSFGALLFLLSSGFSLAFGLMKIVNIAHGSFYVLGAYVSITVVLHTGNFAVAVLAGAVTVMFFATIVEELLLRRYHLQDLQQILLTMGLAFIMSQLCLIIWGGDPLIMQPPQWLRGPVRFGAFAFPKYRIFLIVTALLVGAALWLLLERSRLGASIRACVDDEEMAAAVKINTRRLTTGMFAFSGLLAGLAGAIGAPYVGAYPGLDFNILLLGLVVVIIGGLGSLSGAAVGSVFVGVLDSFGKALVPELSYFTIFAPMIIILAIRPNGLLGRAE